ncbi:MAG: sodium:proton antiporter [Bacteroidetes bacterium]|nr:sodium:proton antiporter [Bacteroidota bacterium]
MTTAIIITICALLLIAYLFDISSALTKIPSVILLLLLGWAVRQTTIFLNITMPDLTRLLPAIGTIGLILIVLDGALELELNKSKYKVIGKSFFMSMIPMLLTASLLTWAFHYFSSSGYKEALLNAIPFCVISSAIAIPSSRNLSSFNREFIVYESSLSDVLGVLFFNFIALHSYIDLHSFTDFGSQILIIIIISFIAILGLSFLLSRIKHHITYTPIILLVILIYEVSKVYNLPGLIFILVFGMFLGNLDQLKRFNWIEKFRPEKLDKEIVKFKDITIEATFLVRALFFLLFGFLMEAHEILNTQTLPWAAAIVAGILLIRLVSLLLAKLSVLPLLFFAPRGLITILLFIAIVPDQQIPLVNNSLIIQTVVLSVLVMMFGLMFKPKIASNL